MTARHHFSDSTVQARMENYLLGRAAMMFDGLAAFSRQPDAETLHRVRVTSRRLRVGLRLFGQLFSGTELRQSYRQVRRVTRTAGAVRTLDVNLQLLKTSRSHCSPETKAAQARAVRMLLAERSAALKEVQELAALLKQNQFMAQLEKMIRNMPRELDSKRLVQSVTGEVERLREVARRREKRWEQKQSSRAFHRLRIAVKKYRYALEATDAVFETSVKSRLEAVEELQDLMGACHDVEVLLEWVRSAKWDKALSRQVEWIRDCLQEDYERHWRAAAQFLKKERGWMKKVYLEWHRE